MPDEQKQNARTTHRVLGLCFIFLALGLLFFTVVLPIVQALHSQVVRVSLQGTAGGVVILLCGSVFFVFGPKLDAMFPTGLANAQISSKGKFLITLGCAVALSLGIGSYILLMRYLSLKGYQIN